MCRKCFFFSFVVFILLSYSLTGVSDFGDIIHTIPGPTSEREGGDLAWDGETLWVTESGGDAGKIYRVSPGSGDVIQTLTISIADPCGLTWDGKNLWVAALHNSKIYKIDSWGEILHTIPSPYSNGAGLAWDGSALWVNGLTYTISKIDPSNGAVLHTIPSPGDNVRGLAWDGKFLWACQSGPLYPDEIYKLNPQNGEVSRSFNPPGHCPDCLYVGLTWDGDYIWNNEVYEYNVINQHTVEFPACAILSISTEMAAVKGLQEAAGITRRFRDNQLVKTPTGQELIKLYYQHSPEVSNILLKKPLLASRSALVLKDVLPGILFLLDEKGGSNIRMTPLRVFCIKRLFSDIGRQGSPELRQTLSTLSGMLDRYIGKQIDEVWEAAKSEKISLAPSAPSVRQNTTTTWATIKRGAKGQ